jgi:hypothetical protein
MIGKTTKKMTVSIHENTLDQIDRLQIKNLTPLKATSIVRAIIKMAEIPPAIELQYR